jgi:hypothetical protein
MSNDYDVWADIENMLAPEQGRVNKDLTSFRNQEHKCDEINEEDFFAAWAQVESLVASSSVVTSENDHPVSPSVGAQEKNDANYCSDNDTNGTEDDANFSADVHDLWNILESELHSSAPVIIEEEYKNVEQSNESSPKVMTGQENTNAAESKVSPPICTEEYTFLPGCCSNIKSCDHCDKTKITIARQSNSEMAAKAMSIDFTKKVNFIEYLLPLLMSFTALTDCVQPCAASQQM